MSERLSIVIPSDLNEEIEKLQRILKMDKSTVVRHLLQKSINEIKIEESLNLYKRGKMSIGSAAELAGITLWEFIEECKKQNIALDFSEEEAEFGISMVKNFDLNAYKKKIEEKKTSNFKKKG